MKRTEATEEIMQIIPAPENMAAVYVDGNGRFEAAERVVCMVMYGMNPFPKSLYNIYSLYPLFFPYVLF